MRISARNQLKGVVKKLEIGTVNAEVTIELPGGTEIAAMITKKSAAQLGIEVGKEAYAIVKASNVIVAVD